MDFTGVDVFQETEVAIRSADYGQWMSAEQFHKQYDCALDQCKCLDTVRRDLTDGSAQDGLVRLRPDLKKEEILTRSVAQRVVLRRKMSAAEVRTVSLSLPHN